QGRAAPTQRPGDERREQRVDQFAREVVQERDPAEQLDLARETTRGSGFGARDSERRTIRTPTPEPRAPSVHSDPGPSESTRPEGRHSVAARRGSRAA